MKKTLTEEKQRIFEIMSQVDKSFVLEAKTTEEGIMYTEEKPSTEDEGVEVTAEEKDVEEQVEEGNAFGNAVKKAKEEGSDTFELGGETHNVQEAEISELGPKSPAGPSEEELKEQVQFFTMFKLKQEGYTADEVKQMIASWVDEEAGGGESHLGTAMETDEYHTGYAKNMTHGFKTE